MSSSPRLWFNISMWDLNFLISHHAPRFTACQEGERRCIWGRFLDSMYPTFRTSIKPKSKVASVKSFKKFKWKLQATNTHHRRDRTAQMHTKTARDKFSRHKRVNYNRKSKDGDTNRQSAAVPAVICRRELSQSAVVGSSQHIQLQHF